MSDPIHETWFLIQGFITILYLKFRALYTTLNTYIVSVEVNISIYCLAPVSSLDNEIDRRINVTAILFLLVQNRQQTHDRSLIGSGANGLGILEGTLGCKEEEIRKDSISLHEKKPLSSSFPPPPTFNFL